jgi:hypothetical protein
VPRAALILLAAPLALAGCDLGEDEPPERIRGAPKEVAGVVARLERATRARDFGAICDQLFTDAARRRAGGRGCPKLLRSTAADLRDPRIRLVKIQIRKEGDARAVVRTTAVGQPPLEDTIELRRERGRYRIAALAG